MSEWKSVEGMSLLDYFAGQALAGTEPSHRYDEIAEYSYGIAEAMLAEREKRLREKH